MKKAFTLVELIVVIGIIGILAGVLLSTFGGSSESARAAQCLANLKNLANACQTYGLQSSDNEYPNALSVEWKTVGYTHGSFTTTYKDHPGWVSWFSKGHYPGGSSKSSQNNPTIGFLASDKDQAAHALTNSCIWTYVAHNRSTFVCPSHVKQVRREGTPSWSYLMNRKFASTKFGKLDRADKVLLFSEIPFMPWHTWLPSGTGTGTDDDAALQYTDVDSSSSSDSGESKGETIGANHANGKNLFAHVAFADGHVEKLVIPHTGSTKNPQIDESQLKNLTSWLCTGTDVSFDGKKYEKLDK